MKKLVLALLSVLVINACTGVLLTDPADAFVGRYTYTNNYFATWGGDSRALSNNGAFQLTKLSSNQVKMTGAWNTIGQVVGNTVSFSTDMQSDASGYITYQFSAGTLSGKTLTFNYTGTGSLKYTNGIAYPYTCSGQIVATNID